MPHPKKLVPYVFIVLFVLVITGIQQIVFLATVTGITVAILFLFSSLPSLDSINDWWEQMDERRLVKERLRTIKWHREWERHHALKARIDAQYPIPTKEEVVPTGNKAFDEYRKGVLERLASEERDFKAFVERLKLAKDQAEFDQFMAQRK